MTAITDELREYIDSHMYVGARCLGGWKEVALLIADRIDAEHERAMADAVLAAAPTEAQLEELGYIALPLDADGVPYHIDDKVDSDHYEDGTVIGFRYFKASSGVMFEEIAVQPNGWDTATWHDPEEYHHYRAPTVEDVLREFADRVCNSGHQWGLDAADTIAEFAAKLRLAEEL